MDIKTLCDQIGTSDSPPPAPTPVPCLPSYFSPGSPAKNRGVFPVHSLPLVPNIPSAKQPHETDPEKDSSTSSQSHHHITSGIRRHITYSSLFFLHPASPLQSILLGFPELSLKTKVRTSHYLAQYSSVSSLYIKSKRQRLSEVYKLLLVPVDWITGLESPSYPSPCGRGVLSCPLMWGLAVCLALASGMFVDRTHSGLKLAKCSGGQAFLSHSGGLPGEEIGAGWLLALQPGAQNEHVWKKLEPNLQPTATAANLQIQKWGAKMLLYVSEFCLQHCIASQQSAVSPYPTLPRQLPLLFPDSGSSCHRPSAHAATTPYSTIPKWSRSSLLSGLYSISSSQRGFPGPLSQLLSDPLPRLIFLHGTP